MVATAIQRQVAARGHPDPRRNPNARGGREAPDSIAAHEDDAASDETDAGHDLGGDAGRVERCVGLGEHVTEPVDADEHEDRGPHPHQRVGTKAGGLLGQFALESDRRGEDKR